MSSQHNLFIRKVPTEFFVVRDIVYYCTDMYAPNGNIKLKRTAATSCNQRRPIMVWNRHQQPEENTNGQEQETDTVGHLDNHNCAVDSHWNDFRY